MFRPSGVRSKGQGLPMASGAFPGAQVEQKLLRNKDRMFAFLRRLFGLQPKAPSRGDDACPAAPITDPRGPLFAAPPSPKKRMLVQRDEIIDVHTRISGYRFTVREPDSGLPPDGQAMLEALRNANLATFAERRMAIIVLPAAHWLSLDFRPLVAAHTVFLLDAPGQSVAPMKWNEVAEAIRASGARLALAGAEGMSGTAGSQVDMLLLDFSAYAIAGLERALAALKRGYPKLPVLMENVGSWPERRLCGSLGAAYCLGAFTTLPDEEQQSGDLSPSRLVVFEMLNLLRQGVELPEITKVAKRDPGVAIKLMEMANSPLLALASPVASLDQAMMVLGRDQLYRWLSLSMFRSGSGSPRDEVLLELALARGRFLELVGSRGADKARCDELFLVGLLSLLDSLLGMAMDRVVERLYLSPEIRQVLLNGTGPFGFHLALAISVEKGRAESVARLAERLGVPLDDVERASADALAWAESAAAVHSDEGAP